MNLVSALLTPLALLLPSLGGGDDGGRGAETAASASQLAGEEEDAAEWPMTSDPSDFPFRPTSRSFEPDTGWQVRIEQRLTIRIAPRAAMPVRPDIMTMMPRSDDEPRFIERKIGRCLPTGRIAGVQPNGGNRLILFMRDNRIISAELERGCRSRDYYSGFYLAPSEDGMLCVDRDALQSRNGANCKLSRIRQLIDMDD